MNEKAEELIELLKTIKDETRPIEGHTDPNAIHDCWNEAFEILDALNEPVESEEFTKIDKRARCDCDLCKAHDEIDRLKEENKKLNLILYHRENGLNHPDYKAEIEISKQAERIEKLESVLEFAEKYTEAPTEDLQNDFLKMCRALENKE